MTLLYGWICLIAWLMFFFLYVEVIECLDVFSRDLNKIFDGSDRFITSLQSYTSVQCVSRPVSASQCVWAAGEGNGRSVAR